MLIPPETCSTVTFRAIKTLLCVYEHHNQPNFATLVPSIVYVCSGAICLFQTGHNCSIQFGDAKGKELIRFK